MAGARRGSSRRRSGPGAGPDVRATHALFVVPAPAADVQGWLAAPPSRPAGDERRRADRDLQGGRRPARVRRAVRARGRRGEPRARPHQDGDREPGDDGALAPVLDRARPVPGPQRVTLEKLHNRLRTFLRRQGMEVSDRQRQRGCRGISDLAAVGGDNLERALRGCLDDLDGFSHVRRRHRRRLRRPPRPRSRASPRCSPRPTTGSRWRPNTGRSRPCREPRTPSGGSPSRAACTPGSTHWWRGGPRACGVGIGRPRRSPRRGT